MLKTLSQKQFLLWLAALVLTLCTALFFRTYPLRSGWFISEKAAERKAEEIVRNQMLAQIESAFDRSAGAVNESARRNLARQRLDEMLRIDRKPFDAAVTTMSKEIQKRHKAAFSYKYLSEADPYYYLNLTQNVVRTGTLGPGADGGRFYNPLRHAPFGNADVINLHPYVGAAVYFFAQVLKPGISLMRAAGLTPLVLTCLAVVLYFLLWPLLRVRLFAFWLAAQVFFLSPVIIQRTTLGWYDTDPYNLIFPVLIAATFLAVLLRPSYAVALALTGAFLTGFYPLFWQGWAFILPLISAASVLTGLIMFFMRRREAAGVLFYAVLYTIVSMALAVLFITPSGFWDTLQSSFRYSSRVQGAATELWPNLLVLVGETSQASLKKWIYLTSHYGVIFFSGLGLLLPVLRRKTSFIWGAVVLLSLPVLYFSFTAERFSVLAVFPLALLTAYGVHHSLDIVLGGISRLRHLPKIPAVLLRGLAFAAAVFIILPRTFIGAHVSGFQSHFIMNDAWYEALEELGEKAPQDAVVHSWWPPGYFVNAVSGLATVVDGGFHHLPENFWMAKAFMSRNEREAAGIFRMLAVSGNKAMEFLEAHGIRGDRAVELILNSVIRSRTEAAGLLREGWTLLEKKEFLDLTHGIQDPPPSYVLVYEDMVKQNLAMQVIDNWSFERARAVFVESTDNEKPRPFWQSRGAAEYTRKMLKVTGQGLPYEAPSGISGREGNRIRFKNGILFDPESGRTAMKTANGVSPVRALYQKNGEWTASVPRVEPSAIAALILGEGSQAVCVALHSDLVPTLLIKLAYLQGQALTFFEPVIRKGSVQASDYVAIYKIDWKQLEAQESHG